MCEVSDTGQPFNFWFVGSYGQLTACDAAPVRGDESQSETETESQSASDGAGARMLLPWPPLV